MKQLESKKGNSLVKVVTGVRRCGKSYLLFEMFKRSLIESGIRPENIIEFAFDRFSSAPLRDPVVPRHADNGILVVGVHDFLLDSSLMDA